MYVYAVYLNSQERKMLFAFSCDANYFSHLKTFDYSSRLNSVA